MSTTPTVPNIVGSGADTPQPDFSSALNTALGQINAPSVPQYTQGTSIAQPNVKPVRQYTPQSTNNQPMTNQATSVKLARSKNNWAAIGNVVGEAVQRVQENKQTTLVNDLKQVMTAKQNIANANAVLQQDPNNAAAKEVLATNKKQLDAILSDPKKKTTLGKALDVSYIDQEKNKTPEIAAYLQAVKEVKDGGKLALYDSSNELKIAEQAANGGKVSEGGQSQGREQQQQSQTPYADAVLAKDLPTIQENPQYKIQQDQKAAAQKQLLAIVPHVIDQQTKMQVQEMKQNNDNALAVYKAKAAANLQSIRDAAALKRVGMQDANRLAVVAAQGANQVAAVMARANVIAGMTNDPNLNAALKAGQGQKELATIDKDMASMANNMAKSQAIVDQARANSDAVDPAALAAAQFELKVTSDNLKQIQQSRDKVSEALGYPKTVENKPTNAQPTNDKPSTFRQGLNSFYGILPANAAAAASEPAGEEDSDDPNRYLDPEDYLNQ